MDDIDWRILKRLQGCGMRVSSLRECLWKKESDRGLHGRQELSMRMQKLKSTGYVEYRSPEKGEAYFGSVVRPVDPGDMLWFLQPVGKIALKEDAEGNYVP